ncbi:MAG: hypothetical protein DHS20C18_30830 [Saprospiraceae bacterium]|nr:MAG: hypothetical protein DHS20C18_30830 [Saprospiraceae bacterium]
MNGDGGIRVSVNPEVNEIIQEHHYYPFGMEFEGPWTEHPQKKVAYLYNGKELNEDLELEWLDYGARWYDPSIGRWNAIDPLAGKYAPYSPYNYALNNPILLIDPDGRTVEPASSLKGNKRKVFNKLRSSNNKYNSLLNRYDKGAQSEVLHYRVGIGGLKSADDVSYAHTGAGNDAFAAYSSKRGGMRALYSGTVTTDFVDVNTEGMNDIGIATTLIHEATHASILAEYS